MWRESLTLKLTTNCFIYSLRFDGVMEFVSYRTQIQMLLLLVKRMVLLFFMVAILYSPTPKNHFVILTLIIFKHHTHVTRTK